MAPDTPDNPRPSGEPRIGEHPGSLLNDEAMGGIRGGKGYAYQDRYIVCHYPEWSLRQGFDQLFIEGTGDVDLRFETLELIWREHIQIKDHEVPPAELREVIGSFRKRDKGMPGVYQRFILASPSLSAGVRPLEAALARSRGAEPFYSDQPGALRPTEDDLRKHLAPLQLSAHADFILEKVELHTAPADFRKDGRACDFFVTGILKHPDHQGRIWAAVQPAYAALLRVVSAKRGETLFRKDAEATISEAFREAERKADPAVILDIHNWYVERFDVEADYELDWSASFDRADRKVPDRETWNDALLPELRRTLREIQEQRTERLLKPRGRCCLSTGIALGTSMPRPSGWNLEIQQPTSVTSWRSDAVPHEAYAVRSIACELSGGGDAIAVVLDVAGKARQAVSSYLLSTDLPVKALVAIEPPIGASPGSIADDVDAVSFAQEAREKIAEALHRYGVRKTHLFFFGPFGLAAFLGQRLTSLGVVQLYEFTEPGYAPSCTLKT
jgi:hypothetical protein